MTGNGMSAAGARLSFVFAMRGPCVTTDTACSSSLVATHLAVRLIEHGECVDVASCDGIICVSLPARSFMQTVSVPRALVNPDGTRVSPV